MASGDDDTQKRAVYLFFGALAGLVVVGIALGAGYAYVTGGGRRAAASAAPAASAADNGLTRPDRRFGGGEDQAARPGSAGSSFPAGDSLSMVKAGAGDAIAQDNVAGAASAAGAAGAAGALPGGRQGGAGGGAALGSGSGGPGGFAGAQGDGRVNAQTGGMPGTRLGDSTFANSGGNVSGGAQTSAQFAPQPDIGAYAARAGGPGSSYQGKAGGKILAPPSAKHAMIEADGGDWTGSSAGGGRNTKTAAASGGAVSIQASNITGEGAEAVSGGGAGYGPAPAPVAVQAPAPAAALVVPPNGKALPGGGSVINKAPPPGEGPPQKSPGGGG